MISNDSRSNRKKNSLISVGNGRVQLGGETEVRRDELASLRPGSQDLVGDFCEEVDESSLGT